MEKVQMEHKIQAQKTPIEMKNLKLSEKRKSKTPERVNRVSAKEKK